MGGSKMSSRAAPRGRGTDARDGGRCRVPSDQGLEEYKRSLDAMTLQEVWSIVTRAWLARRRRPEAWRLIANNVSLVRRQFEGLG